jgi:uncharacterized protein
MFNHQGSWYVINIEEMSAIAIDDETARVIEKITSDDAVLDSHIEEKLKKLGLLSERKEEPPKNQKEIEPVSIVNMSLFLTQSCNLKCVYCYGEGGEYGTGGNMEEHTAWQSVDWLIEQSGKMKKVHIGFFGGEPFLRFPLMKSVVEYARKRVSEVEKKVDFYVTTNGTLLDDETIAFIKEHNIHVMVSFDGLKELQDAQRPYANGKGSYDSIVPGIKKLLEALPETSGHAVIVGDTDTGLVKDGMKEIGFTDISITPASKSLFTEEQNKTKSARDTRGFLNALEEEVETWLSLTRNRDSKGLKSFKDRSGLYYVIISLLHGSKKNHACGAGLGLAGVSCSGDVYLCHRFVGREEYKLGSIFEKELKREEYQKSPVKGNKLCTACFARYYCAGGCKHDNVGACGSVSTPSEDMCRMKCRELELAAITVSRLTSEDRAFLVEQEIVPPKPCPFDL